MKLYEWQKQALEKDNDRALWCCEAGTGKSYGAGLWLRQKNRYDNPVVICPKQIVGDWEKRAPSAHILTPYQVMKSKLPKNPSAIVVDEADEFGSPLFVPALRSKRAERLYEYIKMNQAAHCLLLTATPIRSTPWNLHTLLTYIGRYQDWRAYQKKYFYLGQPYYGARMTWLMKDGWQKEIQAELEANAEIALMKDMVGVLPEARHEIITLKEPKYEKNIEWEASKQFVEDHRLEQRGKDTHVQSIAKHFRKVVVVAHYREQIDDLRNRLSKERETFVLDGRTTNPQSVIAAAEGSSECYFIVQAAVGAGFEIPSFSCMVFASQGYSVRNFVQMTARIRRINALKPVVYYYLQAGKCDRAIYQSIEAGKDFVPSEYLS